MALDIYYSKWPFIQRDKKPAAAILQVIFLISSKRHFMCSLTQTGYYIPWNLVYLWVGPALGGAGPNWEQFQSAQVPSQLAPRSVLDKPRVDYTLARGPLRRGAQLGAIDPIGLSPALPCPALPCPALPCLWADAVPRATSRSSTPPLSITIIIIKAYLSC